ncbi:MAG: AAA family ATPase [Planctomycetota bacterium]
MSTASRGSSSDAVSAGVGGLDIPQIVRSYWIIVVIAGAIGLGLGYATFRYLVKTQPRYTASLVIQILPQFSRAEDVGVGSTLENEKEMEIYREVRRQDLVSDDLLKEVLNEPGIRDLRFLAEFRSQGGVIRETDAVLAMQNVVRAVAIPGTLAIDLKVTLPNALEAANLANAIRNVFLADGERQNRRNREETIRTFVERMSEINTEIERIDLQKANLLADQGLTSTAIGQTEASITLGTLRPELIATRTQLAEIGTTLGSYYELRNNSTGIVYPESVASAARAQPEVARYFAQIGSLEVEIQTQREIGLGPENQQIRALRARLSNVEARYREALAGEQSNLFEALVENTEQVRDELLAKERELVDKVDEAERRLTEIQGTIDEYNQFEEQRAELVAKRNTFEATRENLQLLNETAAARERAGRATPPSARSSPKLPIVVGGFTIGLAGLAAGLVLLKEATETRIRSPRDVAAIPRTRTLGFVPDVSMDPARPPRAEYACVDHCEGSYAEQIRQMRTQLLDVTSTRSHKSILLASGLPGSGTSSLITNLASSFAAVDRRVLIIDANLRRPSQHTAADLNVAPGLAEVLRGEFEIQDAVQETSHHGVSLLAAGSDRRNAYERFATRRMDEVLKTARDTYDYVFIDVAPAVVCNDFAALAARTDASIAVVRVSHEKRGLLARLRNALVASNSEFYGVVLNGVKPKAGGYMKRNFRVAAQYNTAMHQPSERQTRSSSKNRSRASGGQAVAATTDESSRDES